MCCQATFLATVPTLEEPGSESIAGRLKGSSQQLRQGEPKKEVECSANIKRLINKEFKGSLFKDKSNNLIIS